MKIFDAHFHIVNFDFPLVENKGYLPPEFTIDDYKTRMNDYEVSGGALVSGSFQAFDQTYLLHALNQLGSNFVGVANIPADISHGKLVQLDEAGVRAVRFNIVRGSPKQFDTMVSLSNRLYEEFSWHSELYIQNKSLHNVWDILHQLPPFSIDHLGLTKEGIDELLELVDQGVKVKATGFGRLDFSPIALMKKIYSINAEALLFGTDLPSTRAKEPFSSGDIDLIKDHFSKEQQEQIFYKNAEKWYKL